MENTMKMYVTADEAAQILGYQEDMLTKSFVVLMNWKKRLSSDFRQGTYKVFWRKVLQYGCWLIEEMITCQQQEMARRGLASSIMRTGRVYVIKRTKEALRQKLKQRSGSVTFGNSREKIWISTLRILLKSTLRIWRTGLEKVQLRIRDMCLI